MTVLLDGAVIAVFGSVIYATSYGMVHAVSAIPKWIRHYLKGDA